MVFVAAQTLGTGVRHRADGACGGCCLLVIFFFLAQTLLGVVPQPKTIQPNRQPEIHQPHFPQIPVHQNVRGRDVPVHHALVVVHVTQRQGYLQKNVPQKLLRKKKTTRDEPVDAFAEARALIEIK